jgi:hypothetical protein
MALDDGGPQIDPGTLPDSLKLVQEIEATAQTHCGLTAAASGPMQELLSEALDLTAAGLEVALSEREATHPLEEELRGGLAVALAQSDAIVFTEAKLQLPGWTTNLGGFDVAVAGPEGSVVLIETKWGQVWQGIWDVLKLASATRHPRVTAAYAVYAASATEWTREKDLGAGLFGDWEARQFATNALLGDNEKDWEANLKGSPTVYPSQLPGAVDLRPVSAQPVVLLGTEYKIRAVSVAALPSKPLKLERGRLTMCSWSRGAVDLLGGVS